MKHVHSSLGGRKGREKDLYNYGGLFKLPGGTLKPIFVTVEVL